MLSDKEIDKLDDVIDEDSKYKFKMYGDTIPPRTNKEKDMTRKYISAIKAADHELSVDELKKIE